MHPAATAPRVAVVRLATALLLAGSLLLVTACRRPGLSRDQVRDRWVDTYVEDLGLTSSQAGCIIDRWFAELTDAELRPLTEGAEPDAEQLQRIGELAVACGVGPSAPGSDTVP